MYICVIFLKIYYKCIFISLTCSQVAHGNYRDKFDINICSYSTHSYQYISSRNPEFTIQEYIIINVIIISGIAVRLCRGIILT